ncbi:MULTISPECIES: hypothetical protein [unclassified Yoonia]|uniref:hypothetical protein n=1 Tax=unclassified Yoonia TaxID=2629118 RepID=UPI002AFFAF50|nr:MULTISPECIES: hypothetical protein [unclassified Yoonia]
MKSPTCRDIPRVSIVCHMRYALPFLFALTACADIPALDGSLSDAARAAPYPRLLPLTDPPAPVAAEDSAIDARLAALQQRADALRQIDPGALQ